MVRVVSLKTNSAVLSLVASVLISNHHIIIEVDRYSQSNNIIINESSPDGIQLINRQ